MTALEALTKIKELGVNEISERTLKDWFAKRPLIQTTGAEIKRQAKLCGIELKRCDSLIPKDFMPVAEYEEKEEDIGTLISKEELKELYVKKEMSMQSIATFKGISLSSVCIYLKHYKIKIVSENEKKHKMLKDNLLIIAKMYFEDGFRIEDIAFKYNVGEKLISDLLKDNGYKLKKRGTWKCTNYLDRNVKVGG